MKCDQGCRLPKKGRGSGVRAVIAFVNDKNNVSKGTEQSALDETLQSRGCVELKSLNS